MKTLQVNKSTGLVFATVTPRLTTEPPEGVIFVHVEDDAPEGLGWVYSAKTRILSKIEGLRKR